MPRRNRGAYVRFIEARSCYYIQWYEKGKLRKRSTGTANSGEANRQLAQFISATSFSEALGPVAPSAFTVADCLELYCIEHAPSTADPARIGYAVKALLPFWRNCSVSDVNSRTCGAYIRSRQKAPGTVRKELGTLQAAINYAYASGRITSAPKVRLPPRPSGKERWLTTEEAARLLRAARSMPTESRRYLPLFILIALYTVARKTAILSLRWTQVDLERRRINFNPPDRTQTRKRRPIVPIPDRLMTFLKLARRGGSDLGHVVTRGGPPLKNVKRAYSGAARRAMLLDVTPHTLRHTCGTWMAQRGVSLWEIAGYLGHTEARTSELYAHHSPEFLANASSAFSRR